MKGANPRSLFATAMESVHLTDFDDDQFTLGAFDGLTGLRDEAVGGDQGLTSTDDDDEDDDDDADDDVDEEEEDDSTGRGLGRGSSSVSDKNARNGAGSRRSRSKGGGGAGAGAGSNGGGGSAGGRKRTKESGMLILPPWQSKGGTTLPAAAAIEPDVDVSNTSLNLARFEMPSWDCGATPKELLKFYGDINDVQTCVVSHIKPPYNIQPVCN